MRTMLVIGSGEWKKIIFSPVGWISGIAFVILLSTRFTDLFSRSWHFSLEGNLPRRMTITLFTQSQDGSIVGILSLAAMSFCLFVPLLTMDLFAKGQKNNTTVLYKSAPTHNSEIVLGKYIAVVRFGGMLLLYPVLLFGVASWYISGLDGLHFVAGWIGVFLLYCLFSAIGLFVSACMGSPAASAIVSFSLSAAFYYCTQMNQQYAWVRWLTVFGGIQFRLDSFLQGMITTGDLLYFIGMICLFLAAASWKLSWEQAGSRSVRKFSNWLVIPLALSWIAWCWFQPMQDRGTDFTRNRSKSLSMVSLQALRDLKAPLHITGFVNILGNNAGLGLPSNWMENQRLAEPYRQKKKDISESYIYYYDSSENEYFFRQFHGKTLRQIAVKESRQLNISWDKILPPDEVRKNYPEVAREGGWFVRLLECGGRKAVLRSFDTYRNVQQPDEQDIALALMRLIKPAPRLEFILGHGERDIGRPADDGYLKSVGDPRRRESLTNQGFDIDTASLDSISGVDSLTALVIADPALGFQQKEIGTVKNYLSAGGDLVLLAGARSIDNLAPVLTALGISAEKEDSKEGDRSAREEIKIFYPSGHPQNIFPARPEDSVLHVKNLARLRLDSVKVFQIDTLLAASVHGKDLPVAVGLRRKVSGREQRVLVTANADMFSNEAIGREKFYENTECCYYLFNWLTAGRYPIHLFHPLPVNRVRKDWPAIGFCRISLMILFPLLLAAAGTTVYYRRYKR